MISEARLRGNAREFIDRFTEAWPEGPMSVLASIKANYSLALRRVLTQEGAGCDTFGLSELRAALTGGVAPGSISVNGTAKPETLLRAAVAVGAPITLDNSAELVLVERAASDLGVSAKVRVRLRPDFALLRKASDFFPDASIGAAARKYKPGIPAGEDIALARTALGSNQIQLAGCHVHIGRHSGSLAMWRGMLRAYVARIASIRDACGWEPAELDVGGGFAAPTDTVGWGHRAASEQRSAVVPPRSAPTIRQFAEAVAGTLREELRRYGMDPAAKTLLIEPGRHIYSDAGIHLARVLNTKFEPGRIPESWIETDTSEAFLPDVNVEQCRWPVVAVVDAQTTGERSYDVVGVSCGFDILAEEVTLPSVRSGDVLAFLYTGAYQDAGSNNFNAMPRPAMVLVNGRQAEVIKRAETTEEVFGRDVVPQRLGGPVSLIRLDDLLTDMR